MNDLQIFIYSGNQLRTVKQPDGLWWVLRDVCDVLGIRNAADIKKRLDDDEKGVGQIYTPGGVQEVTIINEPGLYSVILRSDKPEAKAFKRWVTHDVLPSIRRTGAYGIPPEKLVHLNDLQKQLEEWRRLEREYDHFTSLSRKRYEKDRANRDKCRSYAKMFEDAIASEIKALQG